MSDLRTPLVIVVVANVANLVLNLVFIYGLDWGLAGSAWATVVSQAGMGAAFAARLLRAPARLRRASLAEMRPLARIGGEIFVRTGGAVRVVPRGGRGARADRARTRSRAHQIAFQLFVFLALVLDAVAIAGQVIVGRALGRATPTARAAPRAG